MKTFGELQIGDKVYSLNYNEWGVLTEHTVTDIKRNDFKSVITIKGYLKYHYEGYPTNYEPDLVLYKLINSLKLFNFCPS